MSPDYHPKHTHTDTHRHTQNTTTTNLTTGYTLCDGNTEDTIKHKIALMTCTSRVYIPYSLVTMIK